MDSWFEDFPFRERRAYVHSATLCNHLAQRFVGASRFELVLRRWMDSRVIFTPISAVDPAAAGIASIELDGQTVLLSLTDDKAHPVVTRVPYDEDGLVKEATLSDEGLLCEAGEGSFYDRLIAANKAIINRRLSPGVKLIAAKIVTMGFPADDTQFRLKLESHVGTRIFKSSLWVGDVRQGEVVYYGQ